MKFILTLVIVLLVVSSMDTDSSYLRAEPSLGSEYASTPFERCMVLYGDTKNDYKCGGLK